MERLVYSKDNLHKAVKLVRSVLTQDLIRKKDIAKNNISPTYGHCYNASGALYLLFGGKHIQLMRAASEDFGWHHWIVDKNDGELIDITAEQYTDFGDELPYKDGEKGKPLSFSYYYRSLEVRNRVWNLLHTFQYKEENE